MNLLLEKYLNLVIPQPLEENEYIRLLLMYAKEGKSFPMVRWAKSFAMVEEIVSKYKFTHNIFITLSTYKKESPEDKQGIPYRRQTIFLDFDQKDFPEFKDVSDYSAHLKKSLPWLYNHCIVASGSGGFHFYIATEVTENIDGLVEINKSLASLTKADIKAANSKQIARIPTSYNLKNPEEKKLVKVVNNVSEASNFKRYTLKSLKKRIDFINRNNEIDIPVQAPSLEKEAFNAEYYCVEQMLNIGCKKGERNFALGRITAKLKKEHYEYGRAKEIVLGWNERCSPPKAVREVEADFNRYWNNDSYKLLGCNLPKGRQKEILRNYCDKAHCFNYQSYEILEDTKQYIKVNEKLLDERNIRRLNGRQYLILFMLIASRGNMSKKNLSKLLNNHYSRSTITADLKKLLSYKIIRLETTGYYLKKFNLNYTSELIIKLTAISAYVCGKITSTEFKTYLALNYLLQTKLCATYDMLAEYLKIEKSSICGYINKLNIAKVIKIQKVFSDKGKECNRYTFV